MYTELKKELLKNKKNLINSFIESYYTDLNQGKIAEPFCVSDIKRLLDKKTKTDKDVNSLFESIKTHLQTAGV